MSQFEERVQSIKGAIETLIDTLRQADTGVAALDARFEALLGNARTITDIISAVRELSSALNSVNPDQVAALQGRLEAIIGDLGRIDVSKLANVTTALEEQGRAIQRIAELEADVAASVNTASTALDKLKREISETFKALDGADGKISAVAGSIDQLIGKAQDFTQLNSAV